MISRLSAYHFAFALCSILTGLLFLVTDYLPMVDLPEHAAQLAIWQQWDIPEYGHPGVYESQTFSPTQTPYLLVLLLGLFLPLQTALKAAIFFFVLGVPLATAYLLRRLELEPWLVFLAFPISLGYSFYWGFLNFLAAVPLVILLIPLVDGYSRNPNRARALTLGLLFLLLFFTHPLAFGYAGLVLGPLVLMRAPHARSALFRSLPLLAALAASLTWLAFSASGRKIPFLPEQWRLGPGRLLDFFNQIVGVDNLAGLLWGLVILSIPFALGFRIHSSWDRRAPLLLGVFVFFAFPWELWSVLFVYRRFAVFTLPLLLFALHKPPGRRRLSGFQKLVPVTLGVVWLVALNVNFRAFGQEAAAFTAIEESLPPNQKVLNLALEYESRFVPAPVFAGFAKWVMVEHGGRMDPSFAGVFHHRFQYRDEVRPDLEELFKSLHGDAEWSAQAASYDYFIVRGRAQNASRLLRRIGPTLENRLELVTTSRDGLWWLFRPIGEGGPLLPPGPRSAVSKAPRG